MKKSLHRDLNHLQRIRTAVGDQTAVAQEKGDEGGVGADPTQEKGEDEEVLHHEIGIEDAVEVEALIDGQGRDLSPALLRIIKKLFIVV